MVQKTCLLPLFTLLLRYSEPVIGQGIRRPTAAAEARRTTLFSSVSYSFSTTKEEEQTNNEDIFDYNNNKGETVVLPAGVQGIRGGTKIDALPWYAVFQSKTLCGGSLIHGDIVLTAAHCVDDNGLPDAVRVGSKDFFNGGTVTDVIGGALYPGWTWRDPSDPDLAIIVLRDFLPNQVAVLNRNPEIPISAQPTLFAMGFGLINDYESSRKLLGASLPYLDDCTSKSYTFDHQRHLCADSRNIATCGGDSGSPVMLGQYSNLQVGINSYSNGKCSTQTLDVYTRVSYFMDWIDEQVCKFSAQPPSSCFETDSPTNVPTAKPSDAPSLVPSVIPTARPSDTPTTFPTNTSMTSTLATATPTDAPIFDAPTEKPSNVSSDGSTDEPTTSAPTNPPTDIPTNKPSPGPSVAPSASPVATTLAPTSTQPAPTDQRLPRPQPLFSWPP